MGAFLSNTTCTVSQVLADRPEIFILASLAEVPVRVSVVPDLRMVQVSPVADQVLDAEAIFEGVGSSTNGSMGSGATLTALSLVVISVGLLSVGVGVLLSCEFEVAITGMRMVNTKSKPRIIRETFTNLMTALPAVASKLNSNPARRLVAIVISISFRYRSMKDWISSLTP